MWTLLFATVQAAPPLDLPQDVLPARSWDVQHLDLDLKIDPQARKVEGIATHTVTPYGLASRALRLHQRGLQILGVNVDGEESSEWRLGPDTLEVQVEPERAHTVAVRYSVKPELGVHFRARGDDAPDIVEAWTQGEDEENRYWFPGWDHPSDRFTLTFDLTAPSDLHAVANGTLLSSTPAEPGWTTWSYRLEQTLVTYLVAFAVGEYTTYVDEGPTQFELIVPRGIPEAEARYGLDTVDEMATFFGDLLDQPYPYGVYRQAVVQRFMHGGMENSTLTLLTDRVLTGPDDPRTLAPHAIAAHELAHQWFGDLLTCRGWRELWLNEGFATFYAARWQGHAHGPETFAAKVRGWARPARESTRPMAARAWSKVDDAPNAAVYTRGATVLHMLRTWLGDARFDAAIAAYVRQHAEGLVETDDLRRVMEEAAGMHLGWFFDAWVHGHGAPTIEASHTWSDDRLTIKLLQRGDGPRWRGPVEIAVGAADGTVERHAVWLGHDETVFNTPAVGGVRWVAVDPRDGVLALWTRRQDPQAWMEQVRASPDAGARLTAIYALGELDTPADDVTALLSEVLQGQHRLSPRGEDAEEFAREAAHALGRLATPAARDALLAVLPDHARHPELTEAVLHALAGFALDGQVEEALARHALDRRWFDALRADALGSLTKVRPSRALVVARTVLTAPDRSRSGDLHAKALDCLGEHGVRNDLPTLRRFLDDVRRNPQHAAGHAAASLIRRLEDDNAAAQLVTAIAPLLDHPDQRTREAAISMLGALGDKRGIAPLQAFAARTTVPRHQTWARDAVQRLRTGQPTDDPDALTEALARIKALEEAREALEERVEEVERR